MSFVQLISSVIFWEIFALIVSCTVVVFLHGNLPVERLVFCALTCMICVGDYVVVGDYKITPPLFFFVLLCTVSIFSSFSSSKSRDFQIFMGYCSILLVVEVLFYKSSWVSMFTSSMLLNLLVYDFVVVIKTHCKAIGSYPKDLSHENIIYTKFEKYLVDGKQFLNPDLSLDDIAAQLGTNRTYLSRAINDRKSTSFSTIVNHYRIEYTMSYMEKHPNDNMDVVAVNCGFRNASTMFYAFKKETGMTPKNWLVNNK